MDPEAYIAPDVQVERGRYGSWSARQKEPPVHLLLSSSLWRTALPEPPPARLVSSRLPQSVAPRARQLLCNRQPAPAVTRLADIQGDGLGSDPSDKKRRVDVRLLSLSSIDPSQPLAIIRARIGLRTNSAIATTAMFMTAVSRNTRCQLPVDVLIMLATGTRKAEVPFAV